MRHTEPSVPSFCYEPAPRRRRAFRATAKTGKRVFRIQERKKKCSGTNKPWSTIERVPPRFGLRSIFQFPLATVVSHCLFLLLVQLLLFRAHHQIAWDTQVSLAMEVTPLGSCALCDCVQRLVNEGIRPATLSPTSWAPSCRCVHRCFCPFSDRQPAVYFQ